MCQSMHLNGTQGRDFSESSGFCGIPGNLIILRLLRILRILVEWRIRLVLPLDVSRGFTAELHFYIQRNCVRDAADSQAFIQWYAS